MLLKDMLPVARSRIGVAPFLEPTEEIRLIIVQLLNVMLENDGSWQAINEAKSELFADLTTIVTRQVNDARTDQNGWVAFCPTLVLLGFSPTKICTIHYRELSDSFPDIKKEIATLISILACRAPKTLRLHQTPILQVRVME